MSLTTHQTMASKGEEFLQRKFNHLFKCFAHTHEGFIVKADAEIHTKQLENTLRRQLKSQGVSDDEIEKRIADFDSDWVPSAMHYFAEMSKFAENHTDISLKEFVAFNMSIRDHVAQYDTLPSWFENSLRASFKRCWSNCDGILSEDGLELLPGEFEDS